MANPAPFPNRPFNLRMVVWTVRQDIPNNRSRVGWQVWVDKTGYSPTQSGGAANRLMQIDGVTVGSVNGSGFDFTGAGPWLILSGESWVNHNADGTKSSLPLLASATYDILGTADATATGSLPTIPRASASSFPGGSSFNVGTTVTINTNRASTSFTHTIQLWEYGVGATSPISTIATGVGGSYSWNVPENLATYFPNSTSRQFFIRTITFNGSTQIGTRDTVFTLKAPSSMVPTISSLTASDDNPTVASVVGAYVQGLSILKATVNASGVQGSTIKERSFKVGGVSAPSGGSIPITGSGTVSVTASCKDSRGRTGSFSGSITVLPYTDPKFNSVRVRRCNSGGTLAEDGTYLRVDLNCQVQSIVNSTQRNSLTIKVYTRPRGGSTWTARNTINHGSLTYNSNFVVSGGGNYPIDESFDVRVVINDEFKTAQAITVVATSAVLMHLAKTGLGVGKFLERGTLEVGGHIYSTGQIRADGNMYHKNGVLVGDAAGSNAYTASTPPATDPPNSYPVGVTVGEINTSNTDGYPVSIGVVVTVRRASARAYQTVVSKNGTQEFRRGVNSDGSDWEPWEEVATRGQAGVPFAQAAGTVAPGSSGYTTVTLPAGRFTQAPRVVPGNGTQGVVGVARVINVTASSFQIGVWSLAGSQIAASGVDWVAVQMTSGDASG